MSYLREAVEQQKKFLINKLIQAGIYDPADHQLYNKTITELEIEYKILLETTNNPI
ncbi:Fur-regulated basic protein FbpA [Aquibacillus saliphilus]|uniref:Fur-regulated basic protein FbpA n=1 Tax=Aquibacillus saliphilus TaxID=1909422 RepID=UPI001CF08D51|nr:Fur-regulated basic protein FbpA [Aquibacillus saliphilus]